jgi:hypothetical protein
VAAACAAYLALILSIQPYDDGCTGELALYELGHVETKGSFLLVETCSSFKRGGKEVDSATIVYWIPWVLGPSAAAGAWFATAGLARRIAWRRALFGTTVATAVFFLATFAFFAGVIDVSY